MKKESTTYYVLVLALTTLFIFSGHKVQAQNNAGFGTQGSLAAEPYDVPKGPVELYGQVLNPYHDYYEKEGERGYEFIQKHNAYRWDDMRHLVPELFPDGRDVQMSANELCDMLVRLDTAYLSEMEIRSYPLANALIPHFPHLTGELAFLDEVDSRLRSKNFEETEELIRFMPRGWENRVMTAKDMKLKTWVVSILRDSALYNCREHAIEKGYGAYVAAFP